MMMKRRADIDHQRTDSIGIVVKLNGKGNLLLENDERKQQTYFDHECQVLFPELNVPQSLCNSTSSLQRLYHCDLGS